MDENQHNVTQQSGDVTDTERRTVGLLTSPGFGNRLAEHIATSLPDSIRGHISDRVTWEVEIVSDPLTGSNVAVEEILEEIALKKAVHEWDYAISLTDLPIRQEDRIIVARTGGGLDVAVISLPPLGVFRVEHRTRDMILEVMNDLYRGTLQENSPARFLRTTQAKRGYSADDEGYAANLRYTAPPVIGYVRLLAGMVYANRPRRLFPSFKTTVATAFATGGYGLIFSTLWELGNAYGYGRLTALTFTAMAILVAWIIVAHDLWERPRDRVSRYLRTLYNASTVLTIALGVIVSYIAIFLLLLLAATVYIPANMLESTIGQEVTPINYVRVAWVTSSVATIAGAIGAGLEDTDAVRNATFGWRQSLRWQDYQREIKENELTEKP